MTTIAFASLVTLLLSYYTILTHATTIDVVNNCDYTVWAAADPGSGQQLNRGDTWQVNPAPGTKMARIWGRTGCTFGTDGNGECITGGCGKLDCDHDNWGTIPKTVFEYALAQDNFAKDTLDISLIEGFNIPMTFTPISSNNAGECRQVSCTADIRGQCPQSWKVQDGCFNPCTEKELGSCGPDGDSKFFREKCPDAYSFPEADSTSLFNCPPGTNYKLSFC